jgi:ribonuclease HIII
MLMLYPQRKRCVVIVVLNNKHYNDTTMSTENTFCIQVLSYLYYFFIAILPCRKTKERTMIIIDNDNRKKYRMCVCVFVCLSV